MYGRWFAIRLCTAQLAVAAVACGAHGAGDDPAKPVRVIVTFAPGDGTDLMARTIGQKLADVWGKPLVVDKLSAQIGRILGELETVQRMLSYRAQAHASTPEGMLRFMREESARARKVIAAAGIQLE